MNTVKISKGWDRCKECNGLGEVENEIILKMFCPICGKKAKYEISSWKVFICPSCNLEWSHFKDNDKEFKNLCKYGNWQSHRRRFDEVWEMFIIEKCQQKKTVDR